MNRALKWLAVAGCVTVIAVVAGRMHFVRAAEEGPAYDRASEGATLPVVSIKSSKSSTGSSTGCRPTGWGHPIARRSVGREVVAVPVVVKSMVSTKSVAGLLVPACGAKAVLLARRGPTCHRRCVR